ncbi:MAG: hypothetical protein IH845_04480 [Nanoarchaeota archaeon]|nr:hypothetical protein [Nanoarchaeota archaeon]
MKRMYGALILGMLFISMFGIVSAGEHGNAIDSFGEGLNNVLKIFEPTFRYIIGDTFEGNAIDGSLFLAKILFLIIIFAIVFTAIKRISFFDEYDWVSWLVSGAVSILAVRFLGNSEVIQSVILPYSAFGIAITAGLPFVLYFLIVKDFTRTMRKISWIFFAVVFIGLWVMRYGEGPDNVGNFGYIYLVTALLSLAMIMFDGTIKHILDKIKVEKKMSVSQKRSYNKLEDELEDVIKRYSKNPEGYRGLYGNGIGHNAWKRDKEVIINAMAALER